MLKINKIRLFSTLLVILLLIIYFLEEAPKIALAYENCDDPSVRCDTFLPCDTCKDPQPADCKNGPSNTDSGGCGTACGSGNPWSQYSAVCLKDNAGGDPDRCTYYWTFNSYVCSTGDKCIAGEVGLRAGNCNCGGVGGIYKYCCSEANQPETCIEAGVQDPFYPPEGQCPGGWIVDGRRVKSAP